jgi:hypothetical protein
LYIVQDNKIKEEACEALDVITRLVTYSVNLVSVPEAGGTTSQLSPEDFCNHIKSLMVSAKGSPFLAEKIFSSGILSAITSLVTK